MGFENKIHNGKSYKRSDNTLEWKMVYKDSSILFLDYTSAIVGTVNNVYSTNSFRSLMNHVINNDLDINSIELEDYKNYYNNVVGESILPNDNDLIEFLDKFKFTLK